MRPQTRRMHVVALQRKVLLRLALAWVGLSAVLGPAALWLEMRKIDSQMLELASAGARRFIEHVEAPELSAPEHREALRASAAEALKAGFSGARVYDSGQRMLIERTASERMPAAPHVHALDPGEPAHYHTYWSLRGPAMQVLLPIERAGRLVGYFEGVYEVDAATAREMLGRLLRALGLVIGVGFVTAAVLYPVIVALHWDLAAQAAALLRSNVDLMEVLGSAVAMRDSDTHAHNYRVTVYAARLGQAHGLAAAEMRRLIAGAFLHDVGKIGISDAILLKPGPLSAHEQAVMRTHVSLGTEILSKTAWLSGAREVVECHHEKQDGTGYPNGLRGEAIPLNARIFAVADVFDALTSRRPYKDALPLEHALAVMRRESGLHFDPRLFGTFDAMAHQLHAEASGAGEDGLRAMLHELVGRYFLAQAPGAAENPRSLRGKSSRPGSA